MKNRASWMMPRLPKVGIDARVHEGHCPLAWTTDGSCVCEAKDGGPYPEAAEFEKPPRGES